MMEDLASCSGRAAILSDALNPSVLVSDPESAARKLANLTALTATHEDLEALLQKPSVRSLLLGLADHSPFLWRLCLADPQRLIWLLSCDPNADFAARIAALRVQSAQAQDDAQIMRALRETRAYVALLAALCDLGGVWDLARITKILSAAADAYVGVVVDYLLRQAVRDGKIVCQDFNRLREMSGLTVLALGKHGARELNYSSDVDLVVFYDPLRASLAEHVEPAPFYVKLTKSMARLLSELTGDGYVLRVDLRLRPDPGSTSVAVSLPAALIYYETLGQNWERAAMIKARPIAGDFDLGEEFIQRLRPFIWRRYFDYAAIADIHAMKRQIHAVRGHSEVIVEGHDVKLGRGGIREIEFFVQTQQLIFGGRRVELRGPRTLDMLSALEQDGWVSAEARDQLSAAYVTLRNIEHRLQMIADEQTQRLPANDRDLQRFANFCGFESRARFEDWLTPYLRDVEKHYARLFENAQSLDAEQGNLVFTGVADDPETLDTLAQMGFKEPKAAAETVRGWHFGRRAAARSARAREVLTELVPDLLRSLAGSGAPDAALAAFDQMLNRMPTAAQLFSILKSNADLRDLFGDVLGAAPRLAAIVANRPNVLDAVIDPLFFGAALDRAFFDALSARLSGIEDTEDFMDHARILAQEGQFAIGVRVLSSALDAYDAGPAFSALAESMLEATLKHVARKFEIDHGLIPGGRVAIIAMGKLGSREMTAISDLDLVLVYDFIAETPNSEGARPLHAVQYYTRLTQRLISMLTAATRRGVLYEVDMRLRPSGRKGPIAVQKSSYLSYHKNESETWEHMALSRARLVCGDATLVAEMTEAITGVLAEPRDPKQVAHEIVSMRDLIAQEKGDDDVGDVKLLRGGLLDIEFLAQYYILSYAAAYPELLVTGVQDILTKAERCGLLTSDHGAALKSAHRFFTDTLQIQRIVLPISIKPNNASASVQHRIAVGVGLPDAPCLLAQTRDTAERVVQIFRDCLACAKDDRD